MGAPESEGPGSRDFASDPVMDWLDAFAQRRLPHDTVGERILELCSRDAGARWRARSTLADEPLQPRTAGAVPIHL